LLFAFQRIAGAGTGFKTTPQRASGRTLSLPGRKNSMSLLGLPINGYESSVYSQLLKRLTAKNYYKKSVNNLVSEPKPRFGHQGGGRYAFGKYDLGIYSLHHNQ
jgi:hypothetical protein